MDPISIVSGLMTIAPQIAKWFAGDKAEEAAQSVVNIARDVTGINTPEQAVKKIMEDRNSQLEFLKQLNGHQENMDRLYLADRQHAREMHQHSNMPALIAISLTVMVAGLGGMLFAGTIPEANTTIANIIIGGILAKWADSIAYFVGSSRGSAEKDRRK